jgi:hypothetical protein
VLAAAHHAQALVERARSLYAGEPPAVPAVGEPFGLAAHAVTEGVGKTTGLSGQLIDRHTALGVTAMRELTRAGRADVLLRAHLETAATTVLSGARQLSAIAERISAITEAAAVADSPAAQRAVWAALRAEVAGVNSVVAAGRQDAIALASRIRGLTYDRPGGQASASASISEEMG